MAASAARPGMSAWYDCSSSESIRWLGLVDHHHLLAEGVERLHQQLAGPAVAGQQQERLPDPRHLGGEPLQGHGVPEGVVLQQGQQRPDRVRPADHRQVDRERHPEPLGGGERPRQLAEADRGRGVAHEVEGVEQRHPGRLAVRVDPRDQRQPDHADREHQDQHDERGPHPPHDQEDGGRGLVGELQMGPGDGLVRRGPARPEQLLPEDQQRVAHDRPSSLTGPSSLTSGSAAVEGDGLGDQQHHRHQVGQQRARPTVRRRWPCGPSVSPSAEICVAHTHTTKAATSCRSATRLVARCTAPIWVRSPNFSTVAIRLTTRAANSSKTLCRAAIADVADEEAEVQGRGQQHEEAEDDLLEIHSTPHPSPDSPSRSRRLPGQSTGTPVAHAARCRSCRTTPVRALGRPHGDLAVRDRRSPPAGSPTVRGLRTRTCRTCSGRRC